MRVYGDPLELHTKAIVFFSIANALESETDQARVSERTGEALQYIRTAIVHATSMSGRRNKRFRRPLKFALIEWCRFKASSRCRGDTNSVLDLIKTLRRVHKGLSVKLEARMAAANFFDALSSECSQKGDASSMAIGDSDD